jgi:transcriptional regulator with XRE-family HTH domain
MAETNFGEQLKRARETQKLSLKDVENEIKIREDFLQEFERGNFDFSLPDIYKRGFLRVYAQFLKLDPEKILDALPGRTEKEESAPVPVSVEREAASAELPLREEATGEGEKTPLWETVRLRLRLLMADRRWQVGGLVALLLLLVGAFSLWSSSRSDDEWESLLHGDAAETIPVVQRPAKKLKILATDTLQVLVREKDTKQKIFSGTLKKGAVEELEYHEDVQISFSEGGALAVQREGGEVLRPRKAGVGWMEIGY